MQDKTAVLTSQKKVELADDDPLSQEKVRVIRVYETLPGPFDYSTELAPDGVIVAIGTRRNVAANIESGRSVSGDILTERNKREIKTRTYQKRLSERERCLGMQFLPFCSDKTLEGVYTYRTLYYGDYIYAGVSESGGVLTTIERKDVNETTSEKILTNRQWLDDADYAITIPNLIPEWARAQIPTITVSHKVKGTASQPSLGTGEFSRAEKQLDAIFKRVTVESLNFDYCQ